MTNTIDQHTRKKLGISSVHYLIMDVCSQYKNIHKETKIKDIAMDTGLSDRAISVAMADLCKCEPRLLEEHENGSLYPTVHWYNSIMGDAVSLTTADAELAKDVISYFNEVNNTKYLVQSNAELIKSIVKIYPRITLEHFKSVILHKKETWSEDPEMSKYNRPATIFRNAQRFVRYLDDANIYWTNKVKEDEYGRANRQQGSPAR